MLHTGPDLEDTTMHSLRTILTLMLAAAVMALLPACSSDDETIAPDLTTFNEVIDSGGTYEIVEPVSNIEAVGTPAEEELPDGTIIVCAAERHSIVDAPLDYATFDPNAELIYPGSLLQGNSLGGATPNPISVDRAGGTVTINLLNGSTAVSRTVDEVRYDTVIQAMNDIIADNNGVLPAQFTYQSAEVQSREQMALRMGVNVNTLTSDVNARLSINTDTSYSSFLVELNQRYFTMVFNMPTAVDGLFADSVTPADLARFVSDGNPATYISSVTYGRRFYLLIESTESVADMQASISASYDAALAGGSGELEGRDFSTLQNVNVKVFALGGDHQLALAAFNGDVDAVAAFLTEGGEIDTGVPMSYTVRNVKDNSTVAIKVATDYEVRNCLVQSVGQYVNDFDGSTEGWTGYADYRDFGVYYGGALDGGYIKLWDRGQGYTCYFRAPLAYHGDWSQFYGGEMSMYLWVGGPGNYTATDDVVFYDGSSNRLALRFGQPSRTGFFPKYVPLDDSGAWLYNGNPATEENIRAVLSDVADLFIRAEYYNQAGDWAAMDRFRVVRAEDK
jgi:thiol-activated cytolysin